MNFGRLVYLNSHYHMIFVEVYFKCMKSLNFELKIEETKHYKCAEYINKFIILLSILIIYRKLNQNNKTSSTLLVVYLFLILPLFKSFIFML